MSKDVKKTFDDLLNIMLVQAETFLNEMGEFFPYGSVLTSDQKIKTVGIYNDKEEMNAQKGIDILTKNIIESLEAKEILIGAIGIDVIISETKSNGLMIKASDDGEKWHERTYSYDIIDKKCIWK